MNMHQEKMDALIAGMNGGRKARTAWQEETEQNLETMQSVAEHQEVPAEHAAVETGKAPKKQYRGRHLAVGRRRKPKEVTWGNRGSQKKMAAACRKMTPPLCRSGMAQGKRHQENSDPGKMQIMEGITRHLQNDDPPYRSGMA
jgi:hypothetical protein